MFRKRSLKQKRVIAFLLTGMFVLQQTLAIPALAGTVTGVDGVPNGHSGQTFNIDPSSTSNKAGFRQYTDFKLDEHDIANLNFKDGIETFVNLVDNQININGLVNTLRDSNFYAGKAIFISPKGMVVGASGVLNVGALGIYTPTDTKYQQFKSSNEQILDPVSGVETIVFNPNPDTTNTAVTIDGKVISAGDVRITAGKISIGENGGIVGGVNSAKMQKFDSLDNAKALFEQIVNSDASSADTFAKNEYGQIYIYSNRGIDIKGKVRNFAKGVKSDSDKQIASSLEIYSGSTGTTTNEEGLTISGLVENTKGDLKITSNEGKFEITEKGVIKNDGDTILGSTPVNQDDEGFTDAGSLDVKGKIETKGGKLFLVNRRKGGLNISGTITHDGGDAIFVNGYRVPTDVLERPEKATTTGGLNVEEKGSITVTNGNVEFENTSDGDKGLNISGKVTAENGTAKFTNHGEAGLNIKGSGAVTAKDIQMFNDGSKGVNIESKAKITASNNVSVENKSTGGVNVKGLVKATNDINIKSTDGNVVVGDNSQNDNYVTAGRNIKVDVNNASLLNAGYEKILFKADGDLTMNVTDGTIGEEVQQKACIGSGCTGVGPKSDGSRDFTKSVNANVKGKVNAKTQKSAKQNDLVINFATVGSDMNIDSIKADGKVILTADDDYGNTNTGTRYSMKNAATNNNVANVEGKGISLIASGNIGEKNKKLTFNQINGDKNKMDLLANNDISMKALDDAKNKDNNICTVISREGDIDLELGGNSVIDNMTAEGNITVITRGTNLTVNNLGHITDPAVTPKDYFGERPDGWAADKGYSKDDFKNEVLPNKVVLKALDISKTTRPDSVYDETGHRGNANSKVVVKNAVLDNGTLDITADQVYANGIHANFGIDGYSKKIDKSTEKVVGAKEIPTGHAVRPEDVTGIGHNEKERNYYYYKGDGDGTFNGKDSDVDDDDGIIDSTPLEIPDLPGVVPGDEPGVTPTPTYDSDGSSTFIQKKIIDENVDSIDKRQYIRFNVDDVTTPVTMERNQNGITELLDVSRGGIAVKHNNELKVGDVLPVHLQYGNLDIKADVKVLSATESRAGAQFINLDKATANKLLYLNILLKDNQNISFE